MGMSEWPNGNYDGDTDQILDPRIVVIANALWKFQPDGTPRSYLQGAEEVLEAIKIAGWSVR